MARSAFPRLWLAAATSDLGDGMTSVAAPLLMTSLTTNPVLVSAAAGVTMLPTLLFGLMSGALVDRWEAVRTIQVTDAVRGVVLLGFSIGLGTGALHGGSAIAGLYVAAFVLGCGETFVSPATQALIPRVVPHEGLAAANAKIQTTALIGTSLVGRVAGAALFAAGHWLPYGFDAASFLLGVALMFGIAHAPRSVAPVRVAGVWREAAEGLSWLWRQPLLRLLAVTLTVMNVTLFAVESTLVLFAASRLHLHGVAYATLLTCIAIGGILGSLVATPIRRRLRPRVLISGGLVIETLTHLALALDRDVIGVGATFVVFGIHAGVWDVTTATARQQLVPEAMRGRVAAAYRTFSVGGAAVGSFVGGPLVALGGTTAPMWASFFVLIVVGVFSQPLILRSTWPTDQRVLA